MYSKNRMTLKKELKAIAKSTDIMDKEEYTYFMENVKIGFTDLEIVNMIYNLLSGYLYQKDDFEYKIADFLFTQLTIKDNTKFIEIYAESFKNNNKVNFELLLRHNVVIVPELVEFMENHLKDIENNIYYAVVEKIDNYRDMLNVIKLYTRKQKIENIRNKKELRLK